MPCRYELSAVPGNPCGLRLVFVPLWIECTPRMRFPKDDRIGRFGTSTAVFQASGNGIFAKKTLQTLQLTIGRHHRLGLQPLNTRRRIALPILAYRNLDLRRPYLTVDHSPAKSTRKDLAVASATSLESTEPEVASTAIPARDRGVVQRLFDAIIAPRSMSFLVSMVVHWPSS